MISKMKVTNDKIIFFEKKYLFVKKYFFYSFLQLPLFARNSEKEEKLFCYFEFFLIRFEEKNQFKFQCMTD